MKIEQRPLAEIKPYEKNPRINDAAVDAVAESIRRFGFRQPIVVDAEGVIVCGHTRWKAAQKLGLEKVPVHVAKDLTPEQIRAYRIADNKSAELAEWNLELLPIEMAELADAGIDWSLLGFDADELAKLLDPGVQQGLTDPDDIPEAPDEATTKPGDIWVLGNHRLMCGDSASAEDVDRLLDGQPIHLCNTDPPYNVKVEPRSNNAIAAGLSSFGDHGLMHHQSFDLHRMQKRTASRYHGMDVATGAQSGIATHKKLRPKDRPLANDFVSDAVGGGAGVRLALAIGEVKYHRRKGIDESRIGADLLELSFNLQEGRRGIGAAQVSPEPQALAVVAEQLDRLLDVHEATAPDAGTAAILKDVHVVAGFDAVVVPRNVGAPRQEFQKDVAKIQLNPLEAGIICARQLLCRAAAVIQDKENHGRGGAACQLLVRHEILPF